MSEPKKSTRQVNSSVVDDAYKAGYTSGRHEAINEVLDKVFCTEWTTNVIETVHSIITRIRSLQNQSTLNERLEAYELALMEMAAPVYKDSNPESLLKWVQSRASAVLKEYAPSTLKGDE